MWIFNSDLFISRSHCGPGWTSYLIFINQFSNLSIALAYFSIPISLFFLWYRRHADIPKAYLLMLFSFFISFCGFTHLGQVLVFFWPAYRFFTLIDILTAIFSIITALALPYSVTYLIKLPSFKQLHQLTDELQGQMLRMNLISCEHLEHNRLLKSKVAELEHELLCSKLSQQNFAKIEELKSLLGTDE